MTTYTNNSALRTMDGYINAAPWWQGKVVGKAGTIGVGSYPNRVKHIQFETVLARAAKIKKGLEKEFPTASHADLKQMQRTLHYFNGIVEATDPQYEDLLANDPLTVEKMAEQIDSLNYAMDQDMEKWAVGYGTTFTSDPDYSAFWVPWFKAVAGASSSIANPGDMNIKVTNIAGTTGTEGTILDMATVLYSNDGTGQTVDFVNATFQPIIRAFSAFKDTENGRRMVDTRDSYSTSARFTMLVDPPVIDELDNIHPYDGEKIIYEKTIGDLIRAKNIDIVPCDDFTSALEEDGTVQFGFVADFDRNFKKVISDPVTFEGWKELPDINSKWVRKMSSRWSTATIPYWDGTYFRKAFGHFSFTYENDAD